MCSRTTRSQNKSVDLVKETNAYGKRKADENEDVKPPKRSRAVLGNITNAASETEVRRNGVRNDQIVKPVPVEPNALDLAAKKKVSQKSVFTNTNLQVVPLRAPKVMTRAAARARAVQETAVIPKPAAKTEKVAPTRRISNEFEKTDESLYLSAHEDFPTSKGRSSLKSSKRLSHASTVDSSISDTFYETVIDPHPVEQKPPIGVIDFDKQTPNDPYEVSEYTMDIFKYLKEREKYYPMVPYMDKQPHITKWMRMLVVDWMVEVQETFELNHETLYLAVKVLDSYLGQKVILKDNLQLLGAAALFISCKFDERVPPMIDDFLFICDGAYDQAELKAMELDVFKTINYDLGFPLSYRFVRRYAKCAFISLPILTLARFVLEHSLMDYETITFSDSKMASAALFIALRMVGKPGWSPTLEYYSGYNVEEFIDIALKLNAGLHRKLSDNIKHVRNKYSHKLFHEVAKIPLLTKEELLEGNELLSSQKRASVINFCQAL
ncbi:G2/mitotic-specific cyclin-B3 [Pseudolycoriella hygida]|uniref:G2/mitotic-specific cyclin-B3 n=1 Tax=Pseudolycoriella hygida TaxID=35572 RepID=A0A9Q0MUL8_9DIPT|nr:G2/mitotic-specific cyclin-B3 [Pseudolycoriella hygida]